MTVGASDWLSFPDDWHICFVYLAFELPQEVIQFTHLTHTTPAFGRLLLLARKIYFSFDKRHSKYFITRAFPLLMSRGLSKSQRLTDISTETLLKLLKTNDFLI